MEPNLPKHKRSSRTPRRHCKRRLQFLRSIHRARIICITDDRSRSNGCHSKATRMRRTSSRCSISVHPSQNGRCTDFVEISKVRMFIWKYGYKNKKWIRLPKHKWPKSWSSMEDPVVSLSEICTVILWQDCYGKGNSRKFCWSTDGKKFRIGSAYVVNRVKGPFLSVYVDCKNWLERTKHQPKCGRFSWNKLSWENQHHALTTFICVVLNENAKCPGFPQE